MTGEKARDRIIDAIKTHWRTKHTAPVKIAIPWGTAWDLAKLDGAKIGVLAGHIWRDGPIPKHLEKMFGIPVSIDEKRETGSIKTE